MECKKLISDRGSCCPYFGKYELSKNKNLNKLVAKTSRLFEVDKLVKEDSRITKKKINVVQVKNDNKRASIVLDKFNKNKSQVYIFEYINENEFKKRERAIKKFNILAYKKLLFDYYSSLREGKFEGVLVYSNDKEQVYKYELAYR